MTQVAIGLYGLQSWFGGDFAPVTEIVRIAEGAGLDLVSITDHVVMGENVQNYPYGRFPAPLDFPWFEPLTVLAVLAGVTKRIRLSTGVVIAPLRPAVLLAKQLATLDVMSRGRVSHWPRRRLAEGGVRRLRRPLGGALHALRRAAARLPPAVERGAGGLPRADRGVREDLFLPSPGAKGRHTHLARYRAD